MGPALLPKYNSDGSTTLRSLQEEVLRKVKKTNGPPPLHLIPNQNNWSARVGTGALGLAKILRTIGKFGYAHFQFAGRW